MLVNKWYKVLALLGISLLMVGCETMQLVEQGEVVSGQIVLESPGSWSKTTKGDITYWTRDGFHLNSIALTTINKGQSILKGLAVLPQKSAESFMIEEGQSVESLLELYVDAIKGAGALNVALVSPELFALDGATEAAKFGLVYDTDFGLTYQSKVLLVRGKKGVSMVRCNAPKEHYFSTYEDEFNALINSARLAKGS